MAFFKCQAVFSPILTAAEGLERRQLSAHRSHWTPSLKVFIFYRRQPHDHCS